MKVGLGPLACTECELYAVIDADHNYHCPRCNNEALDYLWMFTDAQQARVEANSKFYRFVAGQNEIEDNG